MTEHTWHTEEDHSDPDDAMTCKTCRGDLAYCKVCLAAECELPTDCPGRVMSRLECEDVCRGNLDFRNGAWLDLKKDPT